MVSALFLMFTTNFVIPNLWPALFFGTKGILYRDGTKDVLGVRWKKVAGTKREANGGAEKAVYQNLRG